jgi:hypothetical protein
MQQQQRVEQQVLAALRKAGVEDVGVDMVGVSRAQGLWEPMCVRSGQVALFEGSFKALLRRY